MKGVRVVFETTEASLFESIVRESRGVVGGGGEGLGRGREIAGRGEEEEEEEEQKSEQESVKADSGAEAESEEPAIVPKIRAKVEKTQPKADPLLHTTTAGSGEEDNEYAMDIDGGIEESFNPSTGALRVKCLGRTSEKSLSSQRKNFRIT